MSTFKNILLFLECSVLYGKAGEDLSIKCDSVQSTIEWRFNNNLIIQINRKSGSKRKGALFIQNPSKYQVTTEHLKITRLVKDDLGRYSCSRESEFTLYVVSVFAKPGPVLPQSSNAELHCIVEGDPTAELQWLRPPNAQQYPERKQIIQLKSVTSNDEGQWTCQVKDFKINITLTVVGLQTKEVIEVREGGNVDLPCSLPQLTSRSVVGGKWEAKHLPEVSSATLQNTDNTLQWMGKNTSRVIFTSRQLSINYDIKLLKVQASNAGRFDCTVEFDGGSKLTASTTLTVVPDTLAGNKETTSVNGPKSKGPWTKNVFGVQLWIWIAVGASSAVVLGIIILIVLVQRRNKRMKKRVRQLRSMSLPLTAKDYCQCHRSEREEEMINQVRPVPVPRYQRNANNGTQPYY